jgi:Flp pilus assembly pilin Flp
MGSPYLTSGFCRDKGRSRIFFEGAPKMLKQLLRLSRDDEAVAAVEYAMLLFLILVAIISAIKAVGDTSLTHYWENDCNAITGS